MVGESSFLVAFLLSSRNSSLVTLFPVIWATFSCQCRYPVLKAQGILMQISGLIPHFCKATLFFTAGFTIWAMLLKDIWELICLYHMYIFHYTWQGISLEYQLPSIYGKVIKVLGDGDVVLLTGWHLIFIPARWSKVTLNFSQNKATLKVQTSFFHCNHWLKWWPRANQRLRSLVTRRTETTLLE